MSLAQGQRLPLGPRQALAGRQLPQTHVLTSAPHTARRRAAHTVVSALPTDQQLSRRQQLGAAALAVLSATAAAGGSAPPAGAIEVAAFKKDLTSKRRVKIPEEAYTEGEGGVKYYDMVVGTGAEAKFGERVVVHYEAKWKGVTFVTSRQGMGVTGGTPLGFDVGAPPGQGGTLKGLDYGVRGMRVGGRRKLRVPPELAYGKKGFAEIPPDATLDFDVELLSIKTSAAGYQVKLVEG